MAYYTQKTELNGAFLEQNILDNNEVKSYPSELNGSKTVLLSYDWDNKKLFYLGFERDLTGNETVVLDDLTHIFKFKTAKMRKELLFNAIKEYMKQA